MNTMIYFFLGFGYVCLLIWGIVLAKKDGLLNLSNTLLLVIIGLIYDNFIIALGNYIGEGNALESLSIPRYWLHAIFTPTLILFAWSICYKVGITRAKKTFWKMLAFLLTIGLILYELFTTTLKLKLQPKWEYGILTYEAVQQQSPVMVILVTLVLAMVGFILLKNYQFSWLLFGTLIMVAGGFLASWIKNFPIMNTLEFILMLSLLLTRHFQIRNSKVSL